jgi:hypothetical protein
VHPVFVGCHVIFAYPFREAFRKLRVVEGSLLPYDDPFSDRAEGGPLGAQLLGERFQLFLRLCHAPEDNGHGWKLKLRCKRFNLIPRPPDACSIVIHAEHQRIVWERFVRDRMNGVAVFTEDGEAFRDLVRNTCMGGFGEIETLMRWRPRMRAREYTRTRVRRLLPSHFSVMTIGTPSKPDTSFMRLSSDIPPGDHGRCSDQSNRSPRHSRCRRRRIKK